MPSIKTKRNKMIIIAAMTPNRVIGNNNSIPWHNPQDINRYKDDLRLFRKLTTGDYTNGSQDNEKNSIIMGRRTYESIGRPLPNRYNIVVSSTMQDSEGIQVCKSIDDALRLAKVQSPETFITGGARIYEQTIHLADAMYLSILKQEYPGKTLFPEFSKDEWAVEQQKDHGTFNWFHYTRK